MTDKRTLIELVKKWPILYDPSNEDYVDFKKKTKIWIVIGKEINISGDKAKNHWKNLRDAYIKYLRRTRTKRGSKKWEWADEMEMFRPFLTFSNEPSNITHTDIQFANPKLLKVEADEDYTTDFDEKDDIKDGIQKVNSSTPILKSVNTQTVKTKADLEPLSIAHLIFNHYGKKEHEMDATDLLFLAHASTVKTFSTKRQALVKMEIAKVILKGELQHQEELLGAHCDSHDLKFFLTSPYIQQL
ncbi:hypothetical protein FQA39_LY11997 [Lamprigera yunnana]|nr:hypothetical protein FQA39_LY11997 [Lamprigera yunnana]